MLPGFVDLYLHIVDVNAGGDPSLSGILKVPEAEYNHKLWLAHGITPVRGVPFGERDWSLSQRDRSARNEITAPRMDSYHVPEDAREWVRWAAEKGIDGLKLDAYRPEITTCSRGRRDELQR